MMVSTYGVYGRSDSPSGGGVRGYGQAQGVNGYALGSEGHGVHGVAGNPSGSTVGVYGEAWVELPDWFETINTDVRYQLTCVGGYAPVYVAQKVRDNRFQIAGDSPGLEVSWALTALRSDAYIQHYGAPVEVDKPAGEKGTYLHPELYSQPLELGRD
ncbi:MAG: hypothetical protein JXA37_11695 [Chloroflexia bacterium]|nr:hypothetical protein [Chloroflexia bacterium]